MVARTAIKQDIEDYLKRKSSIVVDAQVPAVVRAASTSAGYPEYVSPDQIMDNLPPLPDKLQEFAFQYATEVHTVREWAAIYGVSISAITTWKSRADVQAHISAYRYQRKALAFGRHAHLQNLAYKALTRVLTMRLSATTTETVAKTALSIARGDIGEALKQSGYSARDTIHGGVVTNTDPDTGYQRVNRLSAVSDLERQMEEIRMLDEAINGIGGGQG